MAEYIYGIRQSDGKTISIYDIPNEQTGLKCNCKCPVCQVDLEACSLQGKVNRYFRHSTANVDCTAISTNESALHRMAKEIIAEELMVYVPEKEITPTECDFNLLPKDKIYQLLPYIYQHAKIINCKSVELEKSINEFKPDIVVRTLRGEFFIEIVVTHDIDIEKQIKLETYGTATLRIDLSNFVNKPISRDELKKIILDESNLKDWAFYPIPPTTLNKAKLHYENSSIVKQYLKELEEKRIAEKVAAENAEKRRKREIQKQEQIKNKFSRLLQYDNYNAELVRLRNDNQFTDYALKELVFYKHHKVKPFYIDIPITGEMIFQCDRRIWQGIIFDRYIYKRKANGSCFKIYDIFSKLKEDHKIPIDYDLARKTKLDNGQEYNFAVEVIEKYIDYLEMLGFITSQYTKYGKKLKAWKYVNARLTIDPPNKEFAVYFKEILKKLDRRSPDINSLILQEFGYVE